MKNYPASDVCKFTVSDSRAGMPSWANLTSNTANDKIWEFEDLSGGGVYACFWDDKLIYIGKFTGTEFDPLGGCVIERIHKHMVGFTLRTKSLYFSPLARTTIINNLPEISEAGQRIAQDIASANREIIVKQNGIAATFNKARFASKHWDELEHMSPEEMANRFSFIYKRVDFGDQPCPPKKYLDDKLIKPIEIDLIQIFEPICNTDHRLDKDGKPASSREVSAEFERIFTKHESTFCYDATDTSGHQMIVKPMAPNNDLSEDDVDPTWPDEPYWEVYTTKSGSRRVRHAQGSRPVLLVQESKHCINCLAPANNLNLPNCRVKEISGRGPMISQVQIDWTMPETPQIIRAILEAATATAAAKGKIPYFG